MASGLASYQGDQIRSLANYLNAEKTRLIGWRSLQASDFILCHSNRRSKCRSPYVMRPTIWIWYVTVAWPWRSGSRSCFIHIECWELCQILRIRHRRSTHRKLCWVPVLFLVCTRSNIRDLTLYECKGTKRFKTWYLLVLRHYMQSQPPPERNLAYV